MKMKTSEWVVYGVASISAILAVVLVYGYIQNRVSQATTSAQVKTVTVIKKPKMRSVVVTSRDIFRGETLGVDDVTVLNVPVAGMVAKGVVVNPQNVVGKIANQKMYAGEWILKQKLGVREDNDKQSVEGLLAEGHRAMRLPVTAETGLLGILNPGDHVDVVSVFESADNKRMVSRIILQNISVLSIGQSNRMGAIKAKKEDESLNEEQVVTRSMVALDLISAQAEQLALAMNVGAIHLILRNPVDTALVKTKGVNLKTIEHGKQRPPIYRPKSKRRVIQLMQGDQVQEVQTR